jgi:hypothetical protein
VSTASRRAEFFTLEAREYLSELGSLASVRDHPDAERLVRGARSLRGAALMAGLGTFARAAAGLEAIARQVRDHALAWDPNARDGWSEGLATLGTLIGRASNWDAAEDRQALALAERLERIASGLTANPRVPATPAMTPGVRAFIARESALIAGSLEQAARALAPVPPPAALSAVLERMQSLRGLGASTELSPLPELLDAMELTTRSILADIPAPPEIASYFAEAAQALAIMARSVADTGRVTPPPHLEGLASRLLQSFAAEADVVPIATLAPDGMPPIVNAGAPPAMPPEADPVPLELVSVGDHLLLTAEALSRAATPAARDLRLFVLHRTLATMPAASGTGRFLRPMAQAVTAAIAHGAATARPDSFVEMLRDCGRFLVDAGGETDQAALRRSRDELTAGLAPAGPGEPARIVPIAALAPDEEGDVVPIAALAPDEDADVVPIGALAPDDEADVVPIESLAPDEIVITIPDVAPGAPGRLERAFTAQGALDAERGSSPPTLEGLLATRIVAMESLLYRGEGAVHRAEEVRREIDALLAEPSISLDRLRICILELADLVPLARDAA